MKMGHCSLSRALKSLFEEAAVCPGLAVQADTTAAGAKTKKIFRK